MNEFNVLIKNKKSSNVSKKRKMKKNKFFLKPKKLNCKLIFWSIIYAIILIVIINIIIDLRKKIINNKQHKILTIKSSNLIDVQNETLLNSENKALNQSINNNNNSIYVNNTNYINSIYNNNIIYENITNIYINFKTPEGENPKCKELDPINLFEQRLQIDPEILCKSENSIHFCYKNQLGIFVPKHGLFCKMQNFVLDPSKWKDNGYEYKGPVDRETSGCPLLSEGFFNMKCDVKNEISDYAKMYGRYINSWNYNYTQNENYEEFAPGKIIFFISRNQDSPNLYHGGSEFINAFSLMNILNLNPKNIQIIFLESINFNKNDPLFDLYKYIISGGNTPIHIRDINKKYHISNAIHIPINWDSPCFILAPVPSCNYPTKTYYLLNKYIQKYMNIPNFNDFSNLDKEIFYYPKPMNDLYLSKTPSNEYKKYVTIQWRRIWPKNRKNQQRILGNGPELAEKLTEKLPKDIFVRLVDTSQLSIEEQISVLKKTDYFIGVHGAGLVLSIFLPYYSIVHEILPRHNMNGLRLMSNLSGHKTYSNIVEADIKEIDDCEQLFFNSNEFTNIILECMKNSNFIN